MKALLMALVALSAAACQGGTTGALDQAPTQAFARVGDTDGEIRVVERLPEPTDTFGVAEVRIAANDLLEIDFFDVSELNRTVRVNARGQISMPLIGEVQVTGLTVPELEQRLEQRYGADYLQAPAITVTVKESFGQRVLVDGEFGRIGSKQVTSGTTLQQLVAQSGGVTQVANDRAIWIFREIGGERLVAQYSLPAIQRGQAEDPRIYGGDVVVAFESGFRVAVKNLREALGIATTVRAVPTVVTGPVN
ncbi:MULTISPECIES: polysaccharide biosynthesis/export family protein [unclassified Roseitalea]|uniref:polysaccharide biosynthesis/export family protein n=1 Tax=unclassified Roseitalea TaxID=2639107 RepID=UPI00273D898A|nr:MULTISPECIES: polysaccharide biosynthesis/export family protein [unclassified Roseitalea]